MIEVVTADTEVRHGFTVARDARHWAVTKGMSALGAAKLSAWGQGRQDVELGETDELLTQSGAVEFVESMLAVLRAPKEYPGRTMAATCEALGFLMADGCLLAPLGGICRGVRYRNFWAGLERWLAAAQASCGLPSLTLQSQRLIANLWLCTLEGRNMEVNAEALRSFVMVHYKGERGAKWIDGLGNTAARGLKEISQKLGITQTGQKWSKLNDALSALESIPGGAHWTQSFDRFINEKHLGATGRHHIAFKLFASYLDDNPDLCDPRNLFSRTTRRTHISEWSVNTHKLKSAKYRSSTLGILQEFFFWAMSRDEEFSATDEITNEVVIRPEYFNPIRPGDLDEVRAEEAQGYARPSQTVQMALPLEYLDEIETILLADDMAWHRQNRRDEIEWTDPETRRKSKILCPVLPYLILLLLKLPIRQVQARRLDSGEGDAEHFDIASKTWVPNYGRHAGHWVRLGAKNPERGVLRKIRDTWVGQELCGFYINSNKTSDRKVLFSEESGYVISWQNMSAIDIVARMRQWQEKYNPIEQATAYREVRPGVFEKVADSVADRRPSCFYLFRYPGGNSAEWRNSPPTGQQLRLYWYEVLAELERRLSARGTPLCLISSWHGPSPQASPYTLHGLRHGGLTRLAVQGVHPWILQNILAGHAQYVMTLYYIKPDAAHVSEHLEAKYMEAMSRKQDELRLFLSSRTLEEAHRLAVSRGDEALRELQKIKNTGLRDVSGAIAKLDHGFCSNGRTRCDEGCRIHDRTEGKPRELREAYGPVPLTAGGQVDCARCIFFITGTPFVDGFIAKTNEISVAAYNSGQRYQRILSDIDHLEGKHFEMRDSGDPVPYHDEQKLRLLKQESKSESEVLTNLSESLNAHGELFQKLRALARLQRQAGDTSVPALLYDEAPKIEWRSIPKFEALDALCHSAKWYPSIRVEDAKRERREKVIQMLVRQGKPPVLALMTEDEAECAVDAMTAYCYSKLGRIATRKLFDGQESFESLGITRDVESTIATAIGQPVRLDAFSKAVFGLAPSVPEIRPLGDCLEAG